MKKIYNRMLLFGGVLLLSVISRGQCPVITCPSNITVGNDSGSCGAVVNFSAPTYTDPCASNTQTFNYSGSIVTWTVPAGVTSIRIEARGAQGSFNASSTVQPGMGASMAGDFVVTPGSQLKILVGQQYSTNAGNGGGGGTFVTDISNNPLIVAGGGGGSSGGTDSPDKHGQVGTTGGTGAAGGGVGGTAGNGGSVGTSGFQSGAGGGLLTNGADGWTAGSGGFAFVNGGAGANVGFGIGGFGGGGNGSGYVVGGGGGGYSGGGGGGNSSSGVGGGGGSYNAGTNQVNAGGVNTGNGLVTITYSGNSGITQTQLAGLASGAQFPVGTTVQTFMVSDGLGNNDTCSFTITVTDNEAPVITCPSNIVVNADSGMCSAVVNFSAPVANDNCSIASNTQTAGLASGAAFPIGTTTVSYMATDNGGNSVSCSFDVIVSDNQAPVFSCPGTIAVNADAGMCSAVVTYAMPVATDNCNIASVSMSSGLASGSAFPLGTTTLTFMATDSAGNNSTCSFDIVVSDSEAPVVVCPATITVPADSGNCSAVVTFSTPTATDNCSSASVTQTGGLPSGSAFPVGTTTITYTATDSTGNSSTCSFDVIVNDNQAPVLLCPLDVSSCSPVVGGLTASASDMCSGIAGISYSLSGATTGSGTGDASGTTFNVGATIVSYTATDSSGNTSNCSFTVTVNPLPVIAVGPGLTVCVNDGPVALSATPAGGIWSGPGVSGAFFNPAVAGTGAQTVTYAYTDANGCSNTADLIITVNPCTGIVDYDGLNSIGVYPNPTQGLLNIRLGKTYGKVEILVSQANGQLVRSEAFSKTDAVTLSLEDIATGIYFMTIKADDQVKTVKVIRN